MRLSNPLQSVIRMAGNCWLSRKMTPVGVAALLSLTGGWVGMGAIAPAPVQAYTGRLTITLSTQPGESFEALLRRAEAVARAGAQRSFDRDILVTDVLIIVSAEHLSRISPILALEATRTQWSRFPDTRRWATYFKNAKTLLGFTPSPSTTATAPAPAPPAVTPSQPAPGAPDGGPAQPLTPTQPATDETGGSTELPLDNPPETIPTGRPQILPDRIPSPVR